MHRAYHALPALATAGGTLTNAVYGFTTVLLKTLKEVKPDYLAVTFDTKAPTFRHKLYKEYKATRVKKPQEFYDQFALAHEVAEAFGISVYERDGFEADDVIGSIASAALAEPNLKTIIVTGDLDALQLVDERTVVRTFKKGIADTADYDAAAVRERFGLTPTQIVDLKALAGDHSDNIPGVTGIGEKTAVELLQKFGSVEKIYSALAAGGKKAAAISERVRELLAQYRDDALQSKRLATIDRDVSIRFKLEDCRVRPLDRDQLVALFRRLEFKSLLDRIPATVAASEASLSALSSRPKGQGTLALGERSAPVARHNPNYVLVDDEAAFEALIGRLKKVEAFALDTETTSLDPLTADLVGISLAWQEGKAYYLPMQRHRRWVSALKAIFEDTDIPKYGHNLKFDYAVLKGAGITVAPLSVDSMLASYLLNPGSRSHGLDALVFREFGYEMQPIEALIGPKGKGQRTMDDVPLPAITFYAAEDADYTWKLANKLAIELETKGLSKLFETIEMPLVSVLADMELAGVKINVPFLKALGTRVGRQLETLTKKIYAAAGTEFNVNSPRQLAEVLFERLGLGRDTIKRTKTGTSTAATELDKLKGKHPIIALIGEQRELSKLKSTYLDALPELVSTKTGRVHTDFNQAVAATGRLSSSNPNLQNIPVRTHLGAEIRKAFIAERGYRLVVADYSQFELRIIASLSGDPTMIESFRNGEDIHRRTAAEVAGKKLSEVTDAERRSAKTVNFGIMYGMGAQGLVRATGMSVDEAREYIMKYFELYGDVRRFLDDTIVEARESGSVETLFGRKRFLPELASGVPAVRAAAERMAINHPIQGTQADFIKMAMIQIAKKLPSVSAKSRMILQVHDELVFEVPAVEVLVVAKFVKTAMEGVHNLRVPIVAEVAVGLNWGETEAVAL